MIGQAHGWFEPNSDFVIDKIEMSGRHRSRGHGSSLIRELRKKAQSVGCQNFVFRGVISNNVRAIELYKSMGASGIQVSKHLYDYIISPP